MLLLVPLDKQFANSCHEQCESESGISTKSIASWADFCTGSAGTDSESDPTVPSCKHRESHSSAPTSLD